MANVSKYCIVPICNNTSTANPEKEFFLVPNDPVRRKTWCEAVGISFNLNGIPLNSNKFMPDIYFCEDHFCLENDLVRVTDQCTKILKEIAVPSLKVKEEPQIKVEPLEYIEIETHNFPLQDCNDLKEIAKVKDEPASLLEDYIKQEFEDQEIDKCESDANEFKKALSQYISIQNTSNSQDADLNNRQILVIDNNGPYSCIICNKVFQDSDIFNVHIREEHAKSCEYCKKTFLTESSLNRHIKIHEKRVGIRCGICNRIFNCSKDQKERFSYHICSDSNDNKYKYCDKCGKFFLSRKKLIKHVKMHLKTMPSKCIVCNKGLSSSGNLKVHMRSHSGEKPFQCDICKKSYVTKAVLVTHIRVHTGEKPFKCSQCPKAFSEPMQLRKHFRTHTDERPYRCIICFKTYKGNRSLRQHVLGYHAKGNISTCSVCNRTFVDDEEYQKHTEMHIKEQVLGFVSITENSSVFQT